MIYVNSVVHAVYTTISSFQTVINCGINVNFYDIINTDPNQSPWIDILSPNVPIIPWRSNISQPWKAEYNIPIITQVYHAGDISNQWAAIQELDELTNIVMSSVNCNRTLDNMVNIITGWDVNPYDRNDIESDIFLMNIITLKAEVFA